MDGAPVNEEVVPIRFFLSPYELTPTYDNVNHKFSVKYILNLVLIDGDEKRYFKQHEITLFRIPRVYNVEGPSDNNSKGINLAGPTSTTVTKEVPKEEEKKDASNK
ncbi:MAG: vacuolar protein sorting-associated family 26 protein [archaeon]|nr:vacuolar protein sorting-associated family 26 protein [archaeon]